MGVTSDRARRRRPARRPPAGRARRARRLRRVLGSLIAVVLAWLAIALGLRVAYADEVLPGTRMAGVALGGASEAEVRRRLAGAPGTAVTLTHGSTRFPVRGTAAGLDLHASAERAMAAGREGPLRGLWSSVASVLAPRAVEPEYRSDRAARGVVAAAARQVERPAFRGDLSIDPATLRVTVTAPRPGRAVDRPRTAVALTVALQRGEGGEVPMIVRTLAAASPADVRAVGRQAERYLASPLELKAGGRFVTVGPRQLAPVLGLETGARGTPPRVGLGVRGAPLARLVETIAAERRRQPIDARISAPAGAGMLAEQLDASWSPRRARVRVRPSRPGRELPREAAIAAIAEAIRGGRHDAVLPLRRVPARISTAAARRVTSLIGTFTTSFPCCQPRVTNIRLIAEAVDGTVIAPGERFSLNQTAGPRTREKGYVPAPFIADGELVDSVGGGVSQMSTTVYNAAYFAGLHIDARTPHSFYIGRYPPGREATLDYPGIDLVWTNDTRAPVLLRATTTPVSVSVSLYGDNGGRRVRADAGPRRPVPGRDFAITVTRKISDPDGRTASESSTTTYDRPPPP